MRGAIAKQSRAALSEPSPTDKECAGSARARSPRSGEPQFDRRQAVKYAWPKWRISWMIGKRASPFCVSSYSTRGGLSA